jgi:hypothetical protein
MRPPDFQPTKDMLDNYLNDLFRPQLNVEFDCSIEHSTVRFDTADGTAYGAPANAVAPGNQYLDSNGNLEHEFEAIENRCYSNVDSINIYFVGGVLSIWQRGFLDNQFTAIPFIDGMANINRRLAVIANGVRLTDTEYLDTMVHEIGHILLGEGHPDRGDNRSPLPGTRHVERLMCSGPQRKKDGSSRLIVKQEWDDAENWLSGQVDGEN